MATGSVGEKCDWQHSMPHPRKSPYKRKKLEISLTEAKLLSILF